MRVIIVDRRTKVSMADFSRTNPDALCFSCVSHHHWYERYFVAKGGVVIVFPKHIRDIVFAVASGLGKLVSTDEMFDRIYSSREDGGPLWLNAFVSQTIRVNCGKLSLLNISVKRRRTRAYEMVDILETAHASAAE